VGRDGLIKLGDEPADLDATDWRILAVLQEDCKTPLAKIGEAVGLSAPSVVERMRKLEQSGVVRGYRAVLSGRRLGLDVTAFVGISINYPKMIGSFEREVAKIPDVLECHHVTGEHSLLLKVMTWNTAALEAVISRLRSIPGVLRTSTMVVLSTQTERTQLPLRAPSPDARGDAGGPRRRGRR
jgi:Lrp/AsnC family leucine-responsive transcriptional regulator